MTYDEKKQLMLDIIKLNGKLYLKKKHNQWRQ
jgi:hypothetical protein